MEAKEQQKEALITEAMDIILHAGDARLKAENAVVLAKKGEDIAAKKCMREAQEDIRLAHIAQTEIIQNEAKGIVYPPLLLFVHAQDTLMTIKSEINFSNEIIELYQIITPLINERKS